MATQVEPLRYDRVKETRRAKAVIYSISGFLVGAILLSTAARLDLLTFLSLSDTNKQLFDWLVASATGTFLYLLMEAARAYRLIDNAPTVVEVPPHLEGADKKKFEADKKAQEDASFLASTPWYFLNCVRGPIIAIVVMLALTSVSLSTSFGAGETGPSDVPAQEEAAPVVTEQASDAGESEALETAVPTAAGDLEASETATMETETSTSKTSDDASSAAPVSFEVDLSKASEEILLVVAFILGMYSRVGVAALESIGSSLFQGIWKRAFPDDPAKDGKVKPI